MLIGLTVHFQFSFFSAGSPQSALAIGEALRVKGHEVVFINTGDKDKKWWDDVKEIASEWKTCSSSHLKSMKFDLVIEVGSHLLKEEEREDVKKCVWLYRKNPVFQDTEACLFPFTNPERNLKSISEVWLFDELITGDDIEYIKNIGANHITNGNI
jgi:hypothetical protein